MTNLTEHFTLEEMTYSQTAVDCGVDNSAPPEVVEELTLTCQLLEQVRTLLGDLPIMVTSGYRSPYVNTMCGGSSTSQHLTGQAVDFYVPDFGTPKQVCDAIMAGGIIYDQLIWEYENWVHMSQSDQPRMMALTINQYGTTSGIV